MPKKILAFLSLLILSGLAIASRAPDCYDMGGSNEDCSGSGGSGFLQNILGLLVVAVLGYAYLKDKIFREGATKYVLTLGAMVLAVGLAMKLLGKEAAMLVAAGFVWYHWQKDPVHKKEKLDDEFCDEGNTVKQPTAVLSEPITQATQEDAKDVSDPHREFDFHWGVPAVEWFERRYPRIDHDRDELANKAKERYSQQHGIDMMGADLKLPWLIGYEEGRYAALKITDRTKKQAMRKADKEFNFHDEVLKKIFYDGYDAGFEAWQT